MIKAMVKQVKRGWYFTLSPEDPQVYMRGEYDYDARRYRCYKADIVTPVVWILLSGNTIVNLDY